MKNVISLSSSILRVYEDDPNDPNFIDVPMRNEPKTKVLFELPLYGAKTEIKTKNTGLLKSIRRNVISIQCCVTHNTIELLFDSNTNQIEFLEWHKYLQESEEILSSNINRLCHAQFTLMCPTTGENYDRRNNRRSSLYIPPNSKRTLGKHFSTNIN